MKKHISAALAAVSIIGVALVAMAQAPTNPQLLLKAATATVDGRPEVRLRWTVKEGRIPEGSYNVYRVDAAERGAGNRAPGQKVKVNPAVIALNTAAASAVKLSPRFQFNTLMLRARQATPGVADKDLFSIEPPGPRPPSSTPVFQAMKAATQRARSSKGPGFSSRGLQAELENIPAVRDYLTKIQGAPPGEPAPAARGHEHGARDLNPQAEAVRDAQSRLILGSMANPALGKAMGLAYDDKNVLAGKTYQYILGYTAPGRAEVEVATTTITVGADGPPGAPQGLMARQVNETIVALRWERVTSEEEARLGIAGYFVTRVDAQNPIGAKLNEAPILKAAMLDLTSPTKKLVDPADSFVDTKAVEGNLTYRVVAVDMFGRESVPASVAIAFEDWRTPPPPTTVSAAMNGDAATIRVICNPSNLPIKLNVYRADSEKPNDAPILLTPTPIASGAALGANALYGAFADANVPRDRYYRYLVTAMYAKNLRESSPAISSPMAAPLLTPPPVPTGLKPEPFVRAGSRGINDGLVSISKLTQAATVVAAPTKKDGAVSVSKLGQIGKFGISASMRDIGGVQGISWDRATAGGQPYTYKVYRAVATGYVPTPTGAERSIGIQNLSEQQQRGILDGTIGMTSLKPGMATTALAQEPPRKYPMVVVNKFGAGSQYYDLITAVPRERWLLAGEVKSGTRFGEEIGKAQAHFVKYRVIPVSRWGIEGSSAEITVRIPATLPPGMPTLNLVHPNQTERAHIDVDFQGNLLQEDVTAYRVYRKPLPPRNQMMDILSKKGFVLAQKFVKPDPVGPVAQKPTDPIAVPFKPAATTTAVATPPPSSTPAAQPFATTISQAAATASAVTFTKPSKFASMMLREVSEQRGIGDKVTMKLVDTQRIYDVLGLYDMTGYQEVGVLSVPDPSKAAKLTFTDKSAEPEIEYAYRVVAQNRDGLQSRPSVVLDASAHKTRAAPPASVALASTAGGVQITWVAGPDSMAYIVQRAAEGGKFIQITGMLPGLLKFTDFSTRSGRTYQYQVLAVDKFGNVSQPKPAAQNPFKPAAAP